MDKQLLENLLVKFNIDVSRLSQNGGKTAANLLNDMLCDEWYLKITRNGIFKVTETVQMIVCHPGNENLRLMEIGQYLPDGRYLERRQLPGGIKKTEESVDDALVRQIKEKLHLDTTDYCFVASPAKTATRVSLLYRGLQTLHIDHPFKITLLCGSNILDHQFTIQEKDGTRQVFKWEKINSSG